MSRNPMPLAVVKLLFLGDSGIGKTSFLRQFIYGKFNHTYVPTVGVDFGEKMLVSNRMLI